MVAAGFSGRLAEGSRATIPLQMSGGPQGSRSPDLRRAKNHVAPHMQEQAAEKIDAGLRAALAG